MIVRVIYSVEQEVNIKNKFNKDVDDMEPEEYYDYIDDLIEEVGNKLPDDADISCIINGDTEEVLFED